MWKRQGNIHLPALCLPNRGGYDTINLLQKGWAEDAADFDFGRRRSRSGRCAGGSTDRRGPRTHHRAGQKREGGQKASGHRQRALQSRQPGHHAGAVLHQQPQSPAPPAERRGRGCAAGVVREPRPLPPHRRGRAGVPLFQSGGGRTGPAGASSVETGRRGAHRLHRPEPEPEPGRLCGPNRDRGRPRDPAGRRRHLRHGRRCRPPVRHRWLRHPVRRPVRRTDGPPLSLPDGPAVCSSPQAAGRHPGQGLRQPAGRCRWPGACPGNGRGAVHRIRAFWHLHHAAFGPAGPGARAEAACRGPRPLPCFE